MTIIWIGMTQYEIDQDLKEQKKITGYLCSLADEEDHYNNPNTCNNLFKRYISPPTLLSVYNTVWLQENHQLAKSNGYHYPLRLIMLLKPWEWGGTDKQEVVIIKRPTRPSTSSLKFPFITCKHSSTKSELEGQRISKCTVISNEPVNIFDKGRQ